MTSPDTAPPSFGGVFNYCGDMEGTPLLVGDAPEHNRFVFDPRTLPVHDMRGRTTTLEEEGFLHGHLPFDIGQEEDVNVIARAYRPMVERYVSELTGAPKVVARMPILRWSRTTPRPGRVSSYPADFVHGDFCRQTLRSFAGQCLADDPDGDRWLAGRYAVIQTWRAFTPPPQDMPLAVIDQRTVAAEDVVLCDSIVTWNDPTSRVQSNVFRYNPAHRWNYISDMTTDDVLVFVGFDSKDETIPGIAHAAFVPVTETEREAHPRMSCEMRVFAYWG